MKYLKNFLFIFVIVVLLSGCSTNPNTNEKNNKIKNKQETPQNKQQNHEERKKYKKAISAIKNDNFDKAKELLTDVKNKYKSKKVQYFLKEIPLTKQDHYIDFEVKNKDRKITITGSTNLPDKSRVGLSFLRDVWYENIREKKVLDLGETNVEVRNGKFKATKFINDSNWYQKEEAENSSIGTEIKKVSNNINIKATFGLSSKYQPKEIYTLLGQNLEKLNDANENETNFIKKEKQIYLPLSKKIKNKIYAKPLPYRIRTEEKYVGGYKIRASIPANSNKIEIKKTVNKIITPYKNQHPEVTVFLFDRYKHADGSMSYTVTNATWKNRNKTINYEWNDYNGRNKWVSEDEAKYKGIMW